MTTSVCERTCLLKGGYFIKVQYKVVSFGQNAALVMVNKFVKFDENS